MAKRGRPVSRKMSFKAAPKQAARKMVAPTMNVGVLLDTLDGFSVADLRRMMEKAESLIQQKTEGERRSFIEEVTARAKGLGMSLADLVGKAVPGGGIPTRPAAKKKAAGKRARLAVKYRGPNGEEWSGRGRPARWVTELEAQGRKREEFAV